MLRFPPRMPSLLAPGALFVLVITAGCAPQADANGPHPETSMDIHSQARPDEVRVTHLDLDLTADFEQRVLHGSVALDLARSTGATQLILDTDALHIAGVTDAGGTALNWTLAAPDPVLGARLVIDLRPDTHRVAVAYRTDPAARAVQWLEPAQTTGERPFLFTQGQAILTRSWIPCQDTPGVRATYAARITVPAGLVAVMSAEMLTPQGEAVTGGRRFAFRMPHPIPSYLIAIAIGDLAFRPLGARAGVYAEPAVVEAAAAEFADTEKMIQAAEKLYGPYRWGRYDILVLPPSFPFGGMENPCITFATPTILAGDRSLVALVAHELAHSWSGNLVTNGVWADLWLNEGFTVYFEGRIMEELYGADYATMLQALGWQDVHKDLDSLGRDNSDTQLHPELAGRNPDDAFSNIPYEKGALFLRTIERRVGRARFDEFLRGYFDRFAFQSMTSERFLEYLRGTLFRDDADGYAALDAPTWIYRPGLPDNAQKPHSAAFARVDEAREAFLKGAAVGDLHTAKWTTHEWLHFLRAIPADASEAQLDALDAQFHLSDTGNSEIQFEWLRIGIEHQRDAIVPGLRRFLLKVGRRKFLKPLYQALVDGDWGRQLARDIYAEARPGYHAVSSNTIDEILEKAPR